MIGKHGNEKMIGREKELQFLMDCVATGRHVLIEGPVGVGKTILAIQAASKAKLPFHRVDGDGRYTEAKLSGWYDPSLVMSSGYESTNFIKGPLTQAMETGGILFVNELNRMPEGVQNILLPVMDDGFLEIPKFGNVEASEGFTVIATQNPAEFVATAPLSEALLDRFELIHLDYPDRKAETDIVMERSGKISRDLAGFSTALLHETRNDLRIRRGASVRAAISFCQIAGRRKLTLKSEISELVDVARLTFSSRIELTDRSSMDSADVISDLVKKVLTSSSQKKK